jgi:hypothetical protein
MFCSPSTFLRAFSFSSIALLMGLSACVAKTSSELSDGGADGASAAEEMLSWPAPVSTPTPKEGVVTPITCAWLEGDNCWKAIVRKLEATCKPQGIGKTISTNPRKITYADGSKALSNPFSAIISGTESTAAPNFYLRNPDGSRCGAARAGYPFASVEVGDDVVRIQYSGYGISSVICQDGTTYAQSSTATAVACEDYSARLQKGMAPA